MLVICMGTSVSLVFGFLILSQCEIRADSGLLTYYGPKPTTEPLEHCNTTKEGVSGLA